MKTQKIGLALSGGGYRAAAFHLGVLNKLNEYKILNKINTFSTVSGGSIIGAYYLLNNTDYEVFKDNFEKKLSLNIEIRLYLFLFIFFIVILSVLYLTVSLLFDLSTLNRLWISLASSLILLLFLFLKVIPANKFLKYLYKKYFYGKKKLIDFPTNPQIIINSTNIETGTILSFSRDNINDNTYPNHKDFKKEIDINPSTIDIAFAVTASSAFSPFFSPLRFDKKNYTHKEDNEIFNPMLIDGGIYDNQGIHRVVESRNKEPFDIVICSDCACPYKRKYSFPNAFSLLFKTIDLMMKRIRGFQFNHSIYGKCSNIKNIIYFSIGWDFEYCIKGFVNAIVNNSERANVLINQHNILPETINDKEKLTSFIKNKIDYDNIVGEKYKNYDFEKFKKIKTKLKPINKNLLNELIDYASKLCELQLKLYFPDLIN